MEAHLKCLHCGKSRRATFGSQATLDAARAGGWKRQQCPFCWRSTHNVETTAAEIQVDAEKRYG